MIRRTLAAAVMAGMPLPARLAWLAAFVAASLATFHNLAG